MCRSSHNSFAKVMHKITLAYRHSERFLVAGIITPYSNNLKLQTPNSPVAPQSLFRSNRRFRDVDSTELSGSDDLEVNTAGSSAEGLLNSTEESGEATSTARLASGSGLLATGNALLILNMTNSFYCSDKAAVWNAKFRFDAC